MDSEDLASSRMRCLIANDDAMQLLVIDFIFQQNKFITQKAHNGCEAYNLVLESMLE